MQLTLKLKIDSDDKTMDLLRRTIAVYTGSFNRVAAVGWELPRVNGVELHNLTYQTERKVTKLPSQLVCSARVKATESLQSAFTLKKKGKKTSCPQSRKASIRYDARSSNIKLIEEKASLSTIEGRKHVKLIVPSCFEDRVVYKVCSSELRANKVGQLFLHVVLEIPAPEFQDNKRVIGVDLGVNRPAVTSEGQFLGNVKWKTIEDRYCKLRSALQSKGTKSARRHLRRLIGKVNRFRTDCDHVISRRIVDEAGTGSTIVIEDLTHCRGRMKTRKAQRQRLHSWSFRRLRCFLEYKSLLVGSHVVTVDPRYTSQKCSGCGYIAKNNRVSQSDFCCRKCGLTIDADLNAAINIRSNYLRAVGVELVQSPLSTSLLSPSGDKPPPLGGGS